MSYPRDCSFFFSSRRRHTRLQGDWSSDVCSSDLCRHQEDRCQKGGGEEGGEEGCASQEIGGEESCAKEDGPGSRPTRSGNRRSVELGETPRYSPVIRFALCLTINPKPDRGTRIASMYTKTTRCNTGVGNLAARRIN